MLDQLYQHYERELSFIRHEALDFAARYPSTGSRLLLDSGEGVDPHVERLIEAFSLLAGRVHNRLDDDFGELAEGLFYRLFPLLTSVIPSMSIVHFHPEPTSLSKKGLHLPERTPLATQRLDGLSAKFRTTAPLTIQPVSVTNAKLHYRPFPEMFSPHEITSQFKAQALLELTFSCTSGVISFGELNFDELNICLPPTLNISATIYDWIFTKTARVACYDTSSGKLLRLFSPEEILQPGGFESDEYLLPRDNRTLSGHQRLIEFFALPEKYLFFKLGGWNELRQASAGKEVSFVFYLDSEPEVESESISARHFLLNCVPIVNLFEKSLEPLVITETKTEYLVVPEVSQQNNYEIFKITHVSDANSPAGENYEAFYDLRRRRDQDLLGLSKAKKTQFSDDPDGGTLYWTSTRRPSRRPQDNGTDVFLRMVNLEFDPQAPANTVLNIHALCSNRDLPRNYQLLGHPLQFSLEAALPMQEVELLMPVTATRHPRPKKNFYWRLLANLSERHFSDGDQRDLAAVIREVLFSNFQVAGDQETASDVRSKQLIECIDQVSSRQIVQRNARRGVSGFQHGEELTVTVTENKTLSGWGTIFWKLLASYFQETSGINRFRKLVVQDQTSGKVLEG